MRPSRIMLDSHMPAALRADLEHAAAIDIDYDAKRGLARLQLALGVPALSPPDAQAASAPPPVLAEPATLAGTLGAKVGAAIVGAALVGAGAFGLLSRSAPSHEAPRTSLAVTTVAAPASIPAPVAASLELAPRPQSAPVASSERPRPVADPDAALRRETAHLALVKAQLESHPAEAYRLAQAGHQRFKRGMLRHEREGLAVLALWNMGRRALAARRTRAFLLRYPESPLREPLAQRLDQAHRGAP